ncbi:uncharacterized protein Nmag_4271 (plasmid) [Natrialba magadii ATCC 43099]|uniref:Lipoprotein n=1 Tax=Natrialba magadii (strain ATCC 43099 / DSM 3394 / CCM 3739 / CIP 104546 / IAM 13178 / JCM 8861 / NBRC 102185 / NCIMB 2190 / MS3) TaxID=547559 RepID=D3T2H0_NATMM|nr:hypothetical protein [Natrialba magadii]ADD07779.1 uncharacterized protein Nmag_4271 [Natrialba magadii ATCC 43099]ELY23026.1 hypothetical protein C500_21220 [Natrialba magadii ATCC 43099]
MNRRSLLAMAVPASFAALSGCLGSNSALDDWDFEESEAEAWSYYESNLEVLEAPSEQTAERIETAIGELDEAADIYDTLSEEARDRFDEDFDLFMEVNDFFLAMAAVAGSSRNGLMPFVGQDPPGPSDDSDPFFSSAEDAYRDAQEIYNDLNELQDAIDGDRFD